MAEEKNQYFSQNQILGGFGIRCNPESLYFQLKSYIWIHKNVLKRCTCTPGETKKLEEAIHEFLQASKLLTKSVTH